MSLEPCKLCNQDSTPWVHINGHICEDCYANTKRLFNNLDSLKIFTVIRRIGEKILLLKDFKDLDEADKWAKLQMTFLDREYDYFIAKWDLSKSEVINVEDKRLKVIK